MDKKDQSQLPLAVAILLIGFVILGFLIPFLFISTRTPKKFSFVVFKQRLPAALTLLILGCSLLSICVFYGSYLEKMRFFDFGTFHLTARHAGYLSSAWLIQSSLVWPFVSLYFFFNTDNGRLVTADFTEYFKFDLQRIQNAFRNRDVVPIGVDVKTKEIIGLDEKRRCSHVLTIGATGSGKSTLMFNQVLHAVKHDQPVLVIDPKGEMASLDSFCEIGRKLNPNFDERFKLFSIGCPERSAHYNPLKHGNANHKKDRLLEALNWSEQYYQAISSSYLSAVCSALDLCGMSINLDYIQRLFTHKELQHELKNAVMKAAKSGVQNGEKVFKLLEDIFSRKNDDVLGLQAQISVLNNPVIGHLLSFSESSNEIDLREALNKNQIIYFQLDSLSNPDTARRLGRMIIEDAKALAGYVYQSESDEKKRKFFPIFIDEFGSFASKEFIEFLKQSRGAKFAIHMFCQGLEDLDVVSKEFRRQSLSNPMTTISLRAVDDETVNEIVAVAGTVDAVERSYQIDSGFLVKKTGMGNQRETKQVRIEHDVLKNLGNLTAVLIQKSPSTVRGMKIYFPSHLVSSV